MTTENMHQSLATSPNLTLEETHLYLGNRMSQINDNPDDDFKGLSPNQMANWLYAPLDQLSGLTISTPKRLTGSPVMRYLSLILEEAISGDGKIKATSKGNLPVNLVKQCSRCLPEFPVSIYETEPSISPYTGSNEDRFDALHYTRLLAQIAKIISFRKGCFEVTNKTIRTYQDKGLTAFFIPMLETALYRFNWAYFDAHSRDVDLRLFWVFMLWRLTKNNSVQNLTHDMQAAFPDLLSQFTPTQYSTAADLLESMIECRFINRFLQFWGFVVVDPKRYINGNQIALQIQPQSLLEQTFCFER